MNDLPRFEDTAEVFVSFMADGAPAGIKYDVLLTDAHTEDRLLRYLDPVLPALKSVVSLPPGLTTINLNPPVFKDLTITVTDRFDRTIRSFKMTDEELAKVLS